MSMTEAIEKVKSLRDSFKQLSRVDWFHNADAFADAHIMASMLVGELEQLADEGEKEPQAGIPVVTEEAYAALEVGSLVAVNGSELVYFKCSPLQWRDTTGVTYRNGEMGGLVTTLLRDGHYA